MQPVPPRQSTRKRTATVAAQSTLLQAAPAGSQKKSKKAKRESPLDALIAEIPSLQSEEREVYRNGLMKAVGYDEFCSAPQEIPLTLTDSSYRNVDPVAIAQLLETMKENMESFASTQQRLYSKTTLHLQLYHPPRLSTDVLFHNLLTILTQSKTKAKWNSGIPQSLVGKLTNIFAMNAHNNPHDHVFKELSKLKHNTIALQIRKVISNPCPLPVGVNQTRCHLHCSGTRVEKTELYNRTHYVIHGLEERQTLDIPTIMKVPDSRRGPRREVKTDAFTTLKNALNVIDKVLPAMCLCNDMRCGLLHFPFVAPLSHLPFVPVAVNSAPVIKPVRSSGPASSSSTPVASTTLAPTPVPLTPMASTPVPSTPMASTPVASTPAARAVMCQPDGSPIDNFYHMLYRILPLIPSIREQRTLLHADDIEFEDSVIIGMTHTMGSIAQRCCQRLEKSSRAPGSSSN